MFKKSFPRGIRSLSKILSVLTITALSVAPLTPASAAAPIASTPTPPTKTIIPYSAIASLPGGGVEYIYDLPNGGTVRFPVAPTGFNPLNATPQQLAEYDLPPRPTASSRVGGSLTPAELLAAWKATFAHYKRFVKTTSLVMQSGIRNSGNICTPTPPAGDKCNWAGIYAPTSSSAQYTQGYANFTQPTYTTSSSCNPQNESNWLGLGGVANPNVLSQVGTGPGTAWWEYNTNNPVSSNSLVPLSGDSITLWMEPLPSSNVVNFEVDDVTQGNIWTGQYVPPSGQTISWDGTTIDFITERPENGTSSYDLLEDFGTAYWTGNLVYNGTWNYLNNVSTTSWTMVDQLNNFATLATTGSLGSYGDFSTSWQACS